MQNKWVSNVGRNPLEPDWGQDPEKFYVGMDTALGVDKLSILTKNEDGSFKELGDLKQSVYDTPTFAYSNEEPQEPITSEKLNTILGGLKVKVSPYLPKDSMLVVSDDRALKMFEFPDGFMKHLAKYVGIIKLGNWFERLFWKIVRFPSVIKKKIEKFNDDFRSGKNHPK